MFLNKKFIGNLSAIYSIKKKYREQIEITYDWHIKKGN